ncbi:hypothetical protein B5F40_14825 [Gordonibacter sp. An230]|nr:hypothetical protein B5F40_14825 [Gordonibacter sp. An230]
MLAGVSRIPPPFFFARARGGRAKCKGRSDLYGIPLARARGGRGLRASRERCGLRAWCGGFAALRWGRGRLLFRVN